MKKQLTLNAITLLLATLPCWAFQEVTIKKTFKNIKEISLSTAAGDCMISKASGSDVSLVMTHSYDEADFTPEMKQEGSRLILKEKFDRRHSSQGKSKWVLEVPDNIRFDFSSGSGDLHASGIKLNLKTNVGSGDMKLDKVTGEVKTNSGSGDIELDRMNGMVLVNTGSGDITFSETQGELKCNLGSGSISGKDSQGKFSLNVGSGDIEVEELTLSGASSFNSGSGDAELSLAVPLEFDIGVNSGSGDARLDFAGNKIEGLVIMQANKRNGTIRAPFEFDSTEKEDRGSQVIIKKTRQFGTKNIRIKISTGSGSAEIEK